MKRLFSLVLSLLVTGTLLIPARGINAYHEPDTIDWTRDHEDEWQPPIDWTRDHEDEWQPPIDWTRDHGYEQLKKKHKKHYSKKYKKHKRVNYSWQKAIDK